MDDDSEALREDSLARLISLLESIGGSKVTLIGDTMLDRYHHGFANNLNSTAPVPVLNILPSASSNSVIFGEFPESCNLTKSLIFKFCNFNYLIS